MKKALYNLFTFFRVLLGIVEVQLAFEVILQSNDRAVRVGYGTICFYGRRALEVTRSQHITLPIYDYNEFFEVSDQDDGLWFDIGAMRYLLEADHIVYDVETFDHVYKQLQKLDPNAGIREY